VNITNRKLPICNLLCLEDGNIPEESHLLTRHLENLKNVSAFPLPPACEVQTYFNTPQINFS
jgi:hypothetical protein